MKWHAQVVHVARKDLRQHRWPLAAYLAVAALATLGAVGWSPLAAAPAGGALPLAVLGMTVLALVVQADSPARTTAFWATLPLRPSAVLAAKLLLAAALLLALPLLGQLAGLRAHAVSAGDLPAILLESALTYGTWLALAAVFAALTPDFRTWVLAVVLGTVGWMVGAAAVASLAGDPPTSGRPLPLAIPLATLGALLLVLAHQYRTRDVRRGVALAALLGVATLAVSSLPRPAPAPAPGEVPAALRPAALRIDGIQRQPGGRTELRLLLEGAPAGYGYVLVAPAVRLRAPDGSVTEVKVEDRGGGLNHPALRLGDGLRWLGDGGSAGVHVTALPLKPTAAQREALAAGGARLTLTGHLEVREPRVLAELPLAPGAAAAAAGRRVRVARAALDPEGPAVEVRISSVASARARDTGASGFSGERTEFALVNRARGEAVALSQASGSGSGLGLVVPGTDSWSYTRELRPLPGPGAAVDAAWLAGARLLLADRAPVGSYPVAAEGGTAPSHRVGGP